MRKVLVVNALKQALNLRGKHPIHLIHHSDRGSQYTTWLYQTLLRTANIKTSMNDSGSCDNAPMESFFQKIKYGLGNHLKMTWDELKIELMKRIIDYNLNRPHSKLGYLSPIEFERRYDMMKNIA